MKEKLYVVSGDLLPEALIKTVQAKEMMQRGQASGAQEASDRLGISRSTFYKYRDGISGYYDFARAKIVNVSMILCHEPGVLGGVLGCLAGAGCNILTINQGLPVDGTALVTMSLEIGETGDLETVVEQIKKEIGVARIEINGVVQ